VGGCLDQGGRYISVFGAGDAKCERSTGLGTSMGTQHSA
jgi:hypothetical protein